MKIEEEKEIGISSIQFNLYEIKEKTKAKSIFQSIAVVCVWERERFRVNMQTDGRDKGAAIV